ncbi:SusC/RagA family TonB-linked outer membrane protein [Pedobacter heparinus]|nr:SusC/RagA family TonB-linked outer membrane protein [Pedobacter heparinus]
MRRYLFYFSILWYSGSSAMASAPAAGPVIRNEFRISATQLKTGSASWQDSLKLKRKKPAQLLSGSVSDTLKIASSDAIYTADLLKSPTGSLYNILTGRLSGLYTNQSSGEPGFDGAALQLRGQSPLMIIDGIPRSVTLLDPEEIESVTVLKDALATAMLGVRGSNGALLITTRKGFNGKRKIAFTAQTGVQQALKMPDFLNAYDYANLYNEALRNDGLAAKYSNADLEAYRNGTDPTGHPDVNWKDQVLRPAAPISRYNLNVSGGGDATRYFISLENFNQGGLIKESDANKYSTNSSITRYIVRSNIEVDLDRQTTLGLRLFGRIMNGTEPGGTVTNIFSSLINTPNNAYPVFNPDGSLGGVQQFTNNIYGQATAAGYQATYNRDMIADVSLTRKLDSWAKGLWVRGMASYFASASQRTMRNKTFATYQYTGTGYRVFGVNGDQSNASTVSQNNRQVYAEFSAGYSNRFGANGIDVYLAANSDTRSIDGDLDLNYSGISGKLTYDFNKKYIAELAFGMNRSNRYPKGTPLGLFPALGLAWNIYQEDFMKDSWLKDLKLSASYGKTGWDKAGYYVFNQYYTDASGLGYVFGATPATVNGVTESTLANPDIRWEKSDKLNIGLQGSVLNQRLAFDVQYFNNKYYDLLMQRGRNSAVLGNDYPDENIGINRYTGADFQLKWQQQSGNFSYFIGGNASLVKSRVIYSDEVFQQYSWMQRTGQAVGQPFGYIAEGLYQTVDAGSVAVTGYTPQPGDIKYKDLNNDGIIDQYDEAPIGSTKPLFFYGVTLGFNWKGLDFSALLQGVENRNMLLTGNSEWEFQSNGFGQAYPFQLDRWTPQTAGSASYPRLTAGSNVNNHKTSSYWMHSGDYLRLKTVELGYTLPMRISRKIKLDNIRVFANALNLFTIADFDRVDPEVKPGSYPIQRVINGGISIKL